MLTVCEVTARDGFGNPSDPTLIKLTVGSGGAQWHNTSDNLQWAYTSDNLQWAYTSNNLQWAYTSDNLQWALVFIYKRR